MESGKPVKGLTKADVKPNEGLTKADIRPEEGLTKADVGPEDSGSFHQDDFVDILNQQNSIDDLF